MINDNYQNRKNVVIVMMIIVVAIYIVRLFEMQVLSSNYGEAAESNAFLKRTIFPARGLMYDRNGALLVYNKPTYDVMATMNEMEPFDTLEFCRIVNITPEYLQKRFREIKDKNKNRGYSPYTPQLFIPQLSVKEYAELNEKLFRFAGFSIQSRTLREYAFPCAAHALGSIGEVSQKEIDANDYYKRGDYSGQNGIEKQYEEYLRGVKGCEILLRDSRGRIKGRYEDGKFDESPIAGKDLVLSLDIELQQFGEKLMRNKVGSIVAIEPSSGEILALVSSPNFNPSELVGRERGKNFERLNNDPLKPLLDRPMTARYPPGSTFKMINGLVFLHEGIITPEKRYPCARGYHIGNVTVGCHGHPGPLDLVSSIQHSCNAYYCSGLRAMLDNKKYGSVAKGLTVWKDHMVSFGFGYPLGVDFPTENRGLIPNAEYYNKMYNGRWNSLTVISIAIGQGEVLLTPIQTANAAAILANRGYWYRPHIVKKINGSLIDTTYRKRLYTIAASEHYEAIVKGMELVVTAGTGRAAQIDGIVVCGKTGTAQNPHGKDHSVFLAFAPKDNPKIAIAVFVENAGFGATWAAPIASLMIEKYLTGQINPKRAYLEEQMYKTNLLPNIYAPRRSAIHDAELTNSVEIINVE